MFHKDLIERIKLPFRKDKELYSSFYHILGFYPRNISYYRQALLHKSSSLKVNQGLPVNNERLEFLGDAILDAIVGDIVFRHFTGKREGFLTNTRSKIVQRESLNKIAVEIGLDKLIKSSSKSSSHNSYMCGNAFEALIGAIYLDRGYDCCMKFISGRILQRLIDIDKVAYKEVNFKSKLIEWGQKNRLTIAFNLIEQTKESATTPVFASRVLIEGIACGEGKGYSKKESQQQAAKEALNLLKRKPRIKDSIFERKAQNAVSPENPPQVSSKTDSNLLVTQEIPIITGSVNTSLKETLPPAYQPPGISQATCTNESDSYDFSDVSVKMKTLSKEDIIAAAESEAFNQTGC